MLNFFRRIRRMLLNESQLKKYSAYAIGEIFLVVIGILIALQINNWNQRRIESAEEGIVLSELKNDLKRNIEKFESSIMWEKQMITNIHQIVYAINNENIWHDTLGNKLTYLRHYEELYYLSATYESLNSGGFDIIASDDIRRKIIRLYDETYKISLNRFNTIVSTTMNNREALFQKHMTWDSNKGFVIPILPLSDLKNSEFTNMLALRIQFKNYAIRFNEECIKETSELIDQIDLYLAGGN